MSSYGQSLLREYLDLMIKAERLENYRPDWLFGLELDFYYPALKVGVEFQGDQHFAPTDFGMPFNQKRRDRRKKQICAESGVSLAVIDASNLEWTCLRGKLSAIPKRNWIDLDRHLKSKLTKLNTKCSNYRYEISNTYGAITAHRIGSEIRRERMRERWA